MTKLPRYDHRCFNRLNTITFRATLLSISVYSLISWQSVSARLSIRKYYISV